MEVFYEKDSNPELLKDKTIAIIGYGSQGHAHANNLKDSGFNVILGLRDGSSSAAKASEAGFEVASNVEAASKADVLMMLIPDEFQGIAYKEEIEPNLKQGATLAFAHGFNIHFEKISPPETNSVIMIAPKGPGHTVRSTYVNGGGVPSLIAVYRDSITNNDFSARDVALSYAKANGGTRAGVLETSFKEETETDLFGEQAVLCGGITALIKAGYETLVEAGYSPEMAYFECLHETKLITDLIQEGGIANMHYSISNTAEYGDYLSGPKVITDKTKEAMKEILENIQSGNFANEFLNDCRQSNDGSGGPFMKSNREATKSHPIEEVGKELRSKMKFLNSQKLVDKEIN